LVLTTIAPTATARGSATSGATQARVGQVTGVHPTVSQRYLASVRIAAAAAAMHPRPAATFQKPHLGVTRGANGTIRAVVAPAAGASGHAPSTAPPAATFSTPTIPISGSANKVTEFAGLN